jgi:hypothetical protein
MSRQYFHQLLGDSLVSPVSAVSPGTTATFLLSNGASGLIGQSAKFLPLPYGQNAPSPGSVFHICVGGLFTSVAGTFIFNVYHGSGQAATTTTGGVALGASQTITPTAYTAGFFRIEGDLIYRSISELATSSTCWFNGTVITGGPAANTNASQVYTLGSASVATVDTTGLGTAGGFGAMNILVTPGTTGSTFTTEYAYIYGMN